MELRALGATGLRASVLGLGTVKIGRNRAVKYPSGEGHALPSDDEVDALLAAAADAGINLLDTAPAYGSSEERLGAAMARNAWFGSRDRWIFCTKAGEEFDNDSGASRFDFSPEAVRASVERSLRRLRAGRLDCVLLHSDGRDEWILRSSGAVEALADLAARGAVRSFGISLKDPAHARLATSRGCSVLMITYSLEDPTAGRVIADAHAAGAGVLVKKALASGYASDPAAALRFAAAAPGVSSVVVGTASPERVRANAAILTSPPPSP